MSLIRNEVEWCQRVSLTPSQVADSRGFATNFRSSTMWTDTTRAQYARAQLTLPSDLTDAEWAVLEPFLPQPSQVSSEEPTSELQSLMRISYALFCLQMNNINRFTLITHT